MTQYRLTPDPDQINTRIDSYLAEQLEATRSAVQSWLAASRVTVEGKPDTKNYRLRGGEQILVDPPDPALPETVRHRPDRSFPRL